MEYVYVGDKPYRQSGADEFLQAAVGLTGNTLISLIDAFKSKNFGYANVSNFASDLTSYKTELAAQPMQANLFVDSGGYSIIKGDIPPDEIDTAIDCYAHFLKHYLHISDYIFSLDIPLSIKYDEINTVDFIKDKNKESLRKTLAILDQSPASYDKFYFVWHFKMREQYEIWDALFREFDLSNKVSNYAIGGLVGLRKSVQSIDAAPFLSMAFRCFLDHSQAQKPHKPLRLHFLGVSLPQDRFQIALLEKLFTLLSQGNFGVTCTYDSFSYMHDAIYKIGAGELYQFNAPCLTKFTYDSISPVTINHILKNATLQHKFQCELTNLKNKKRKKAYYAFAPLEVFSQMEIDKYLQSLLTDEIVNSFKEKFKHVFIANVTGPIRKKLQGAPSGVFNNRCIGEICKNLNETYTLFQLLHGKCPSESINNVIMDHIKAINFPFKLK